MTFFDRFRRPRPHPERPRNVRFVLRDGSEHPATMVILDHIGPDGIAAFTAYAPGGLDVRGGYGMKIDVVPAKTEVIGQAFIGDDGITREPVLYQGK